MWVGDLQLVLLCRSLLISVGRSIDPVLHTDSVGDQDSVFRREKPDEKIQLEVPLNNATT